MANIIHVGGTKGINQLKLNVFCQPKEPSKKDGIWIQSSKEVVPSKYITKKYFARFGNYLGKTGYSSIVFNNDDVFGTYTLYDDRFLWRPFVGNEEILFVGAEVYSKTGGSDEYTWHERSQLSTFSKSEHTFSKERVLSGGYTGSSPDYSTQATTNAFEVNGYFYLYSYFEVWRDDRKTSSEYVSRKYDRYGLVEESSKEADKFPSKYFAIGSVRGDVYAIYYDNFKDGTSGIVINNADLYKVTMNNFVPLFTKIDTIPTMPSTQRAITVCDGHFYFCTSNSLIKYNPQSKKKTTYKIPSGYSHIPSIAAVGAQIFITDMSLAKKKTYLFDTRTNTFTQITHSDEHAYALECLLCENEDRLLMFPARYVEDQSKEDRDESDMDVTAFDITKDSLSNKTVAIEDNPIYDTVFYETANGEVYLRGLFGNVWLYENDDYQEYPTYIGDGDTWRKVKN